MWHRSLPYCLLEVLLYYNPTIATFLTFSAAMQAHSRGYGGDYGGRNGGRDSYSDRRAPRYSPYRGRDRERSPRHSPYRGYRRERSRSPRYSPYRRWNLDAVMISSLSDFTLIKFGHADDIFTQTSPCRNLDMLMISSLSDFILLLRDVG